MKLQQLRFLAAIAKHNLNISTAAEHLYTSQPGVSKQIKLLEEELGVQLFSRHGKHLTQITPAGRRIIEHAESILREVENIRTIAAEFCDDQKGTLSIATTHTQARYVLPPVVTEFRKRYPNVVLHLHQGTPKQIAQLAVAGEVDFAIATEAIGAVKDLVMIPCYRWNRSIVVPTGHPLCDAPALTLELVAQYPIVTYVFGFTGRSQLDAAFGSAGLKPNLVFTATDADIIKTYVRLGLGIGIIARMAYLPEEDSDLVALDAGHLVEANTTKIGFRRGLYLRNYMYDFMALFAPHLRTQLLEQAANSTSQDEVDVLCKDIELPEL